MDLFSNDRSHNLLPYNGEVIYYGCIFSKQDAANHLQELTKSIVWKHDEAVIFGKHITTKRMAAWYGDQSFAYTYSNITKKALAWTPHLLELKKRWRNYPARSLTLVCLIFTITETKVCPGIAIMKNLLEKTLVSPH